MLLPARLRRPVGLIYRFARESDDFADEGDLPDAERLALLATFSRELERIERNEPPGIPRFTTRPALKPRPGRWARVWPLRSVSPWPSGIWRRSMAMIWSITALGSWRVMVA